MATIAKQKAAKPVKSSRPKSEKKGSSRPQGSSKPGAIVPANIPEGAADTERGGKAPTPYVEAVGRRKTAIARVRATAGSKTAITVNGRTLEQYFGIPSLCAIVSAPLMREGFGGKYAISVHVKGGGIHAQAEAIRHGLSRILVKEDPNQKSSLKKLGFLKRDSRQVERKHFGLKKARKRKQWKKR